MVEQRGIEPLTSALRTRRSAKLSYCPTPRCILGSGFDGVKDTVWLIEFAICEIQRECPVVCNDKARSITSSYFDARILRHWTLRICEWQFKRTLLVDSLDEGGEVLRVELTHIRSNMIDIGMDGKAARAISPKRCFESTAFPFRVETAFLAQSYGL